MARPQKSPQQVFATQLATNFFKPESNRLTDLWNQFWPTNYQKVLDPNTPQDKITTQPIPTMCWPRFVNASTIAVHEDHAQEADYLHRSFAQLETDMTQFEQVICSITLRCKNAQDYRNALPDVLVKSLHDMDFPRTEPEHFLVRKHPVLAVSYKRLMDIIARYTAHRLIY